MIIEVSAGEVADRAAILTIKSQRLAPDQIVKVVDELAELASGWKRQVGGAWTDLQEWQELFDVNCQLWEIEDDIREHERNQDFGPTFVRLARSVYLTNDKRAALKRAINAHTGAKWPEQKGYRSYQKPDEV